MKGRVSVLWAKVKRRLSIYLRRVWRHLPFERYFLLRMGRVPDMDAVLASIRSILGYFNQDMFTDINLEQKRELINDADHTLDHEFNYLGSGWVKNNPIKWNIDLKTNNEWPLIFYDDVRSHTLPGADIKSPWEMSRSHHLLWLGEAYLITEEEKYAKEIVSEIEDWIKNNPFMYGVNWVCPMDAAIRAVNWMYAVNFISSSPALTDAFVKKFYVSLFLHGTYIYNNLEKGHPFSNNHYTSNLTGLLYIGSFFENKRYGKKWLSFAQKEFYNETKKQILPSGIHYEKSISYHRLMVELTAYPTAMLIRTGKKVPSYILSIIQSMYEYIDYYTKPNGKAPLLADNDDGRFLPFLKRDFREHHYLLDKDSIENKLVYQNVTPLFQRNELCAIKYFQDAQVVAIKKEQVYLFLNNSGYSRQENTKQSSIGTHTHNDQLSFDFSVGDVDVIVDPGSLVYTSNQEYRNEFRSTHKHNTIVVDGEEQNELSKTDAFLIKKNVTTQSFVIDDNSVTGLYTTIKEKMSHKRCWQFSNSSLVIDDTVFKEGCNHKGVMYYHLDSGLIPEKQGNNIRIRNNKLTMDIRFDGDSINRIDIIKDTISPSYGVLKDAFTIVVHFSFSNNTILQTLFKWA